MILPALLLDIAPIGGGVGISAGIIFFLVLAAVALVMYKVLKRTVKMAVRMMIVTAILLIAIVGGLVLFLTGGFFGSSGKGPVRPTPRSVR